MIQITKDIHFIGVFDKKIRTFDVIMKTANGTSYNSYLVRGNDGVAVIDTVKKEFEDIFFQNLEQLCSYDEIKYIILNHLEPDHSGALSELRKKAPNAEIIISTTAQMTFQALMKEDIKYTPAHTGMSVTLGNKTINFYNTPYLHWPDTMSLYLVEDKILFSGDVFGCHFFDERMFDDSVGDFDYAFKYYYQHIMRPFKRHVLNALKIYDRLDIKLIAPSHGPIIREDPKKYINLYRTWSDETQFSKKAHGYKHVSVFYVSSYGNTAKMAEAIYRGADSIDGIRASLYDVESIEEINMVTLLEESDAVIIGSPTINGDAVKPVWDLLSCVAYIETLGKLGAVFGSYGWSGEAHMMVQQRLKGLKFRCPLEPLRVKLIPTNEELENSYMFGKEIAEIANGKMIEITL